jgi:hypothetical protein
VGKVLGRAARREVRLAVEIRHRRPFVTGPPHLAAERVDRRPGVIGGAACPAAAKALAAIRARNSTSPYTVVIVLTCSSGEPRITAIARRSSTSEPMSVSKAKESARDAHVACWWESLSSGSDVKHCLECAVSERISEQLREVVQGHAAVQQF